MRTYYVDVMAGDDVHGDGTSARPYKSISNVATRLVNGDEVVVNDSFIGSGDEYVFTEPTSIKLINLSNINIRFVRSAGQTKTRTVWKVGTVDPAVKANIYMFNCDGIRIDGAVFMSQSPLTYHAHAIKVMNSSNITVSNCSVHRDWEVDNAPIGSFFYFYGCNAVIANCGCSGVNNSYSQELSFITVDGPGDYELYSNYCMDVTNNNGRFNGLKIGEETRKVTLDGLLVHDVKSDLIDHAVGILILSDNSPVDFTINGGQFSFIDVGIKALGVGNSTSNKRIKRSTFFNCRKAVVADDSFIEVYNVTGYSSLTLSHEYPPGTHTNNPTYGIWATNEAKVDALNCIFCFNESAFYAEQNSIIEVEYSVWYGCSNLKIINSDSDIRATQYIRRIDPLFEDVSKSPYGSFVLSEESACIDGGKRYGDPYLGLAPDIGAMERSKTIKVDDLPALIARTNRYSIRVPLTNIDIEGMIVKGLDTYDPEVQSGREGSAVRDITVKPLVGLLSPYTTELEYIRDNLSFAKIETLSVEAADALAANLFVTRRTGDVASGIIRVYFESTKAITIPSETEFRSNTGLSYYSRQDITISAEEMALNFENGMYFVDVPIEAGGEGMKYNVLSGSISTVTTTMPSGAVAVSNPSDVVGGQDSETNQELKDRIETAITVRDLVTKKGITYVIPDIYKFVDEVRPIGFRDPEMERDLVLGYHVGGKVDIYTRTYNPIEDTKIIEVADERILLDSANFGNVPILQIQKIEVLDADTLDTTGVWIPDNKWRLVVNSPNTRFSVHESNYLEIDPDYQGLPIKIYYKWIPEIRTLQDWVDDSDHRVVCADLLIRAFVPALTDFSISYYAPEEIVGLDGLLKIWIDSVKSDTPLQASDIVDRCYFYGAIHVIQPFTMRVSEFSVNGDINVMESEDELFINRTSRYLANNITVKYMGPDPSEVTIV